MQVPDNSKLPPEVQLEAIRTLYRIPPGTDTIVGLHERYKEAREATSVDSPIAWRKVQECLKTSDPLLAFAAWYSTWVNGNVAFAQMYSVEETRLGMGMTLFAIKPFRVQMFMFRPGAVIPEHGHPDVESYEVYVAGAMELTIEGVGQTIKEFVKVNDLGICDSNGGMIRVRQGQRHGGLIFSAHGGCFLSIQHWIDNWEDGSVSVNWQGEDGGTHG